MTSGRTSSALICLCLGAALTVSAQAAPWAVPDAPVRFEVNLGSRPSHPSCGYFVHLPDGGILPGSAPIPTVVTPDGKTVASYVLWHNPVSGVAVVFEDPGRVNSVEIYIQGGSQAKTWTPKSGLTPSAILCAYPGSGSLASAKKLSTLGRVDPSVHYRNKAGINRAPLSIGGDDTGRPRPGAFYLLSHIVTTDPGETWIAPFGLSGEHEVQVNGERINPRKRIDKWGGTGMYVDLPKGLNRVEIFASTSAKGPYGSTRKDGGLMYLTLRTPKASMAELGGVRSNKLPMAGTSRMETRVFNEHEISSSGSASVVGAERQDGGPVAVIQARPSMNFWFEGEEPLIIYTFKAQVSGNPKDTVYTWHFGRNARMEGETAEWIFPGLREHEVTLTAQSGRTRSQATYLLFAFSTQTTSMNDERDRTTYRRVCQKMLEAVPPGSDPTDDWTPAQWQNLFRTLDFGKGYYLLHHLFDQRWSRSRPSLPSDQVALLEDLYLEVAPRVDAQQALATAREFQGRSANSARRNALKLREIEIAMYYLGETNGMYRMLSEVVAAGGDSGERARIRLGDLALISGDVNLATKYYADVQNRVRHERNKPSASGSRGSRMAALQPDTVASWKLSTMLETSIAEQFRTQLDQGYLLEANQTLTDWERNFPLSKISGDYILSEARLYARVGDYQRVRPLLAAYVEHIDSSAFLPEAAELLLDSMLELRLPDAEIQAYCRDMVERLKFHPSVDRFKGELNE